MINYVYQYIKLLRDMIPQEWVWNQYWKLKEIEFDCLDVSGMAANSPSDFARYLSGFYLCLINTFFSFFWVIAS